MYIWNLSKYTTSEIDCSKIKWPILIFVENNFVVIFSLSNRKKQTRAHKIWVPFSKRWISHTGNKLRAEIHQALLSQFSWNEEFSLDSILKLANLDPDLQITDSSERNKRNEPRRDNAHSIITSWHSKGTLLDNKMKLSLLLALALHQALRFYPLVLLPAVPGRSTIPNKVLEADNYI